jgi:bifunctional aspartokinase / homoserine dehydrogenase 1
VFVAYFCATMKVLKFGGTSVGSPDSIRQLIQILKGCHQRGERITAVFSAFSKVTDGLLDLAARAEKGDASWQENFERIKTRHFEAAEILLHHELQESAFEQLTVNFEALHDVVQGIFLLREASARSLDFVVSFGERCSAMVIAHAMNQAGIPSEYLDARRVVRTDAHFGHAKVDFEVTNRLIADHFANHHKTQAVTGFIGSTADGLTTTLGRGGSDYTAAIFGAALDAEVIEIWTDVDGVLTADPRRVKKAFTQPYMSYREAMEMSHFGAKVIYPPTILPALDKHIPLLIRNTFNPDFPGTYIGFRPPMAPVQHPDGSQASATEVFSQAIKGISSINNICLLTVQGSGLFGVQGMAARLFGALARSGVNIVIITQGSSETSITFAVSPAQADTAKNAIDTEFVYELRTGQIEPPRIERELSAVAVVGENMRYQPGIAGRIFSALGRNGVNIVAIAQGSSELNISIVIPAHDETKALNAIHEAFFLSDVKSVHLFMVGVGLIGGTLLRQIADQAAFLRENRHLEIKVVGLANSKRMVLNENGIDLSKWETALQGSEHAFSMPKLIDAMTQMNLPNTIFLDNTASADVAAFYEQILEHSISISTPNKQAASSPYQQYRLLKQLAVKRNVYWRYETNVGAGLPVITTLNDLLTAGDRIQRIEGVLSGTMSFIFNTFCASENAHLRFSEVVREAKQRGLTEPDPRDDLGGTDVRRKLLILAREAGAAIEMNDIPVQNILPQPCMDASTVDQFFEELERADAHFEQLRQQAWVEKKVLRFVAKLENGVASCALLAFDQSHPFYFLSGSDNMIVFTTDRYRERPLVVRGPGAGAEVTAAGVFAEVVSMVS